MEPSKLVCEVLLSIDWRIPTDGVSVLQLSSEGSFHRSEGLLMLLIIEEVPDPPEALKEKRERLCQEEGGRRED